MGDDTRSRYENELLRQIHEIESKIRALGEEKHALQRLLVRARRDAALLREVGRRNSADRVLIESRVQQELRQSKGPMRSHQLYAAAASVIQPLNPSTFRSHLHRLKKRGIIRNANNQPGVWELVGGGLEG